MEIADEQEARIFPGVVSDGTGAFQPWVASRKWSISRVCPTQWAQSQFFESPAQFPGAWRRWPTPDLSCRRALASSLPVQNDHALPAVSSPAAHRLELGRGCQVRQDAAKLVGPLQASLHVPHGDCELFERSDGVKFRGSGRASRAPPLAEQRSKDVATALQLSDQGLQGRHKRWFGGCRHGFKHASGGDALVAA